MFTVQCGGCGILPLLFFLCSRQSWCVWFCLKLNFLWWNSSNAMTLGYCTCFWRMWAATHRIFLFPFFLAESRPAWGVPWAMLPTGSRWPTQLPRGRALGASMKRCLHGGLTSAEGQHLQTPWLSSSVTWGMSHSFSKELQHWRFLICCQELER